MIKSFALTAAALVALTAVAEAKGGRQVFNAPGAYDYTREKKAGYRPDYCVDAVGNHTSCVNGARAASPDDAYISSYKAPK